MIEVHRETRVTCDLCNTTIIRNGEPEDAAIVNPCPACGNIREISSPVRGILFNDKDGRAFCSDCLRGFIGLPLPLTNPRQPQEDHPS